MTREAQERFDRENKTGAHDPNRPAPTDQALEAPPPSGSQLEAHVMDDDRRELRFLEALSLQAHGNRDRFAQLEALIADVHAQLADLRRSRDNFIENLSINGNLVREVRERLDAIAKRLTPSA
jgi:hypothetical protein